MIRLDSLFMCCLCMCFADYRVSCNNCHGSNDEIFMTTVSGIRVGKCVMVHANTGHGCQGHVMTEHEFWIGSCDYCTWLSQVMRWLDISSKCCHGSMTWDDCYGSWLGCLSFDDYHRLCDDWAWGLKAVMGHAITGHHCNSWYAKCACFFLDCRGSSNGFEPHRHHWGPGRVFRDTGTLAKKFTGIRDFFVNT